MSFSEADTRAKLIDPALHRREWSEDLIRREETDKGIYLMDGRPRRKGGGRVDYILRIRININSQPIAVALIEAKSDDSPPEKGLEQVKRYARLNNVQFVYSSNGYRFVEYDNFTGKTSDPRPMEEFPTPPELRERYEKGKGFSLENEIAKPLLAPYPGGEASRRYYQDAAIRAILEKIAKGEKKALLSLATGSGKTFIAVQLLKKIVDAGQLRRALFVCDRKELRTQALGAFQNVLGSDAAPVSTLNPQKNARILIATYQTLNVASEEEDAKFFLENYPENYFSHIIIDECHRSAWGKWSIILKRNPDVIQIGLTATPRYWESGNEEEKKGDEQITANNLAYFGEPVYEYSLAQGQEDGYLPACEVIRRETDLDKRGITREDIERLGAKNPVTGKSIPVEETSPRYEAPSYEDLIQLPDRVRAWCKELFGLFLQTGDPHQKTVIFCVRDTHADAVAVEMGNLYADWCEKNNQKRLEPYAFKCTASVGGSDLIADLRGSHRDHFIATTVELITTGVDVPILQNIVFFKYVNSPISFHQMMGRGSRIDLPTNKLMFRVYDFTNATRLLGKAGPVPKPSPTLPPTEPPPGRVPIQVEGFEIHINSAGTFIVIEKEGKMTMVSVEEYKEMIAKNLVEEVKTFDDFNQRWINPQERRKFIDALPNDGSGIRMLQEILNLKEYDTYDVLAEIGFGVAPKTRTERLEALQYKHDAWFKTLPPEVSKALLAIAKQFEVGGTEELENPHIFDTPDVKKAGGLQALQSLGDTKDIIDEVKKRLFAA